MNPEEAAAAEIADFLAAKEFPGLARFMDSAPDGPSAAPAVRPEPAAEFNSTDVLPAGFKISHQQQAAAAGELLKWLLAIQAKKEPYWISLLGHWGSGKSMLAQQVIASLKSRHFQSRFRNWVLVLGQIRGGNYDIIAQLSRVKVLCVDDFGKENNTEMAREKLYELMTRRERQWTLWTSNMMLPEIAQKLDGAIASRLLRNFGVVCPMNKCPDFWLEKAKGVLE